MVNQDWVRGMPQIDHVDQLCDGCLAGKHQCTLFPEKAEYHAKRSLEVVHGDLCGLITPTTSSGKKVFLLLVDDYNRFMWVALLRSKDEASEAIKRLRAEAESDSGKKMSCLRTDRGGEFTSDDFNNYCAQTGVRCQLTAPYSPQ
jgi:hypothetical protein